MWQTYNVMEADSGSNSERSIGAVYGSRYYNQYKTEESRIYGYQGDIMYYREGGHQLYSSLDSYRFACDMWGYYRAMTLQYAIKVNQCHDLELETGVLYKLFGDLKEAFEYTGGDVLKAKSELGSIRENAIDNIRTTLQEFVDDMDQPMSDCESIRTKLDNVNTAIKNAGEVYSAKHKDFFDKYEKKCFELGIEVEDFSNEVVEERGQSNGAVR